MQAQLTDRDKAILRFERERMGQRGGAKEEAVRQTFGLSNARYYQLLNILIDQPAALEYDPQLVHWLLDARQRRIKARASRTYAA